MACPTEDPLRGGDGLCSGDAVVTLSEVAVPVVDERRGSEASVMARWRFPPLQPTLSDRVRVLRWGIVAAANLIL